MLHSEMFQALVTTEQGRYAKLPKKLSSQAAVAMPTVYSTVIYCLTGLIILNTARYVSLPGFSHLTLLTLSRLLTHSACGSAGIAAVQVCQAPSAEVSIFPSNWIETQVD